MPSGSRRHAFDPFGNHAGVLLVTAVLPVLGVGATLLMTLPCLKVPGGSQAAA